MTRIGWPMPRLSGPSEARLFAATMNFAEAQRRRRDADERAARIRLLAETARTTGAHVPASRRRDGLNVSVLYAERNTPRAGLRRDERTKRTEARDRLSEVFDGDSAPPAAPATDGAAGRINARVIYLERNRAAYGAGAR